MACQRLLISDYREELDLFNNILPVYSGKEDLADKIRYYLQNVEEYNKITLKSREIVKLNHDSKACVKSMLDKITY